jgi:heme/copper-type cytochrome/quinol oxidase subunit 2
MFMETPFIIILSNTEKIQDVLLYIVFPIIGTLLLVVACFATFSVRFSSIKDHPQVIHLGNIQLQVSLVALIFLIGVFFFSIWLYFLNQDYDEKMIQSNFELEKYKAENESLRDNKIRLTFTMELDSTGLKGQLPDLANLEGKIYFVNEAAPMELSEISPAPAGNAVRIEVELKRQQLIKSIVLKDKVHNKNWRYDLTLNPFEPNIKLTLVK